MKVQMPDSLVNVPISVTSQTSSQNQGTKKSKKKQQNSEEGVQNPGTKLVSYQIKGITKGLNEEEGVTTKLRDPQSSLEYEEVKTLNSQSDTKRQKENHKIIRQRRNNSSDERRKSSTPPIVDKKKQTILAEALN